MSNVSLILLSAGESNRFGGEVKKQWLRIDDIPLWLFVKKSFEKFNFAKIVVVSNQQELKYMSNFDNSLFVKGGESRQESLKNALSFIDTQFVLVTDVARATIPSSMVERILNHKEMGDVIVPYLKVVDTIVYNEKTIDREKVKLVQTPQLSKTSLLKKALNSKTLFTDESSAIEAIGGKRFFVEGSSKAKKITYSSDLREFNLPPPSNQQFIGFGFDVHPLIEGNQIVLGGIKIASPYKFKAHSDGDVLIHSLIDALVGAIGYGDIGELFPDSDERYKNINSEILLKEVVTFIKRVGFEIVNIDITIIAETPKISPFKREMRENLSKILDIDLIKVNIKATTTEKLGFIGRKEAIAVEAVANVKYFRWDKRK